MDFKLYKDSLNNHTLYNPLPVSSESSNESLQRPSPTRTSTANTSLRTAQQPESRSSTTTGSGRRKLTSSSTESRRLIRMCSKERLHQSNASSSEDLPNATAVEPPRRPRRTRYHTSQSGEKSEKDSPRLSASKTSTADSRRSDERLSSRSHRSERSSTRTSKGTVLHTVLMVRTLTPSYSRPHFRHPDVQRCHSDDDSNNCNGRRTAAPHPQQIRGLRTADYVRIAIVYRSTAATPPEPGARRSSLESYRAAAFLTLTKHAICQTRHRNRCN